LTLNNEEIESLLNRQEKESKAIRADILEICWIMRGGLQYDDAMLLSDQERQLISKMHEKHIDVSKKAKMPYY
jgi:hypothetical protein